MMHAKDVGHSFYVRELRIQQDFVPGLDLSLHFTATKVGKYEIVCTQLCGLGHYNMKAYLNVMSQDDFDKWLKAQSQSVQYVWSGHFCPLALSMLRQAGRSARSTHSRERMNGQSQLQ